MELACHKNVIKPFFKLNLECEVLRANGLIRAQSRQRKRVYKTSCKPFEFDGVADGARTHDNRNHNPGLYQLSYSHRRSGIIAETNFISGP